MLGNTIKDFYNQLVQELENTNSKELKEVLSQLKELNEKEKEIVIRPNLVNLVGASFLEMVPTKECESFLAQTMQDTLDRLLEARRKYVFKVKLNGFSKQVTREIAIPSSCTLHEFVVAILLSYHAEIYHEYELEIDNRKFINDSELSEFDDCLELSDYQLNDIAFNPKTKIKLWYDFGADYEFEVKFVKKIEELGNYPIEVLKGKGYGIWEDNPSLLEMYFVDPNQSVKEIIGEDLMIKDIIEFDPDDFDKDEINEYMNDLLPCYTEEDDDEYEYEYDEEIDDFIENEDELPF